MATVQWDLLILHDMFIILHVRRIYGPYTFEIVQCVVNDPFLPWNFLLLILILWFCFQDAKLKHRLGDAKLLLFEGENLGRIVRFLLCSLEVMGLSVRNNLSTCTNLWAIRLTQFTVILILWLFYQDTKLKHKPGPC